MTICKTQGMDAGCSREQWVLLEVSLARNQRVTEKELTANLFRRKCCGQEEEGRPKEEGGDEEEGYEEEGSEEEGRQEEGRQEEDSEEEGREEEDSQAQKALASTGWPTQFPYLRGGRRADVPTRKSRLERLFGAALAVCRPWNARSIAERVKWR